MALTDCPDCGRRVSDRAEACPACAHPIAGQTALAASAEAASPKSSPRSRSSSSGRPKRAAHVVAVPAPTTTDAAHAAVVSVVPEHRVVETHLVVCVECGEEEVLGYRASQSRGYVCIACEERALEARARRRVWLQWWPLGLVVVLLCCALAGLSWAMTQNKPPPDPVKSWG